MRAWHRQRFEAAIEYLQGTAARRRFAGDLTVSEIHFSRRAYSRDLAKVVRAGRYEFAPAQRVDIFIDGKERALYRPEVLDAAVERVLSEWLSDTLASVWPQELYSYRPGISAGDAIRAFAAYISRHRQRHPEARTRGLWVLRRDIKSYGSSIPLDTRLWDRLESQLGEGRCAAIGKTLLRSFLPRRYVHSADKASTKVHTLELGTPTGSYIQPTINNFFLVSLDKMVAAKPGFYARFGDDILYAAESKAEAEAMGILIDTEIARLGLRLSEDKSEQIYFNGSGHQESKEGWPSRTAVDFLGVSLSFSGRIRLRKDKVRRLRRELEQRLRTRRDSLAPMRAEERVPHLGKVVRSALTLSHPLALRDAQALWTLVDDRNQLKELDRWLQRLFVELVVRHGIRGFRRLPPRRLYALGLPSIRAQRNLGCWSHESAMDE